MIRSLPLKYRPEKFEDLVGQEINARFLSALIQKGQIGRNIILYGSFGSSKTTSARIYARALNCLNPTESGSPCNECENCNLFYAGTMADYREVDGATQGGKDQIKELLEILKAPPLIGKFRVITIDECQGLSKQAWDALLKIIEEPPPYLVFVFTTTEINKVREAIQSRCQNLEVKLLESQTAKKHLTKICKLEQFEYEDSALELITYLSGGHPRDLLKNLEQVTYLGDITLENTKEIFNIGYIKYLVKVFKAIFRDKEPSQVIKNIKAWHDAPVRKMNIMREFILFIQYKEVYNIDVVINPVFEFIPKADIKTIWGGFIKFVEGRLLESEKCWSQLTQVFKSSVNSSIELDVFILDLWTFVHNHNFNIGNFEKPAVSVTPFSKKKIKNKRGRQFVGDYKALEKKQPSSKLKTQKQILYPHNLLQHGFILKKKSDLNIVE